MVGCNNVEVVDDLDRSKFDDGVGGKTWLEWVQKRREIGDGEFTQFLKGVFVGKRREIEQ